MVAKAPRRGCAVSSPRIYNPAHLLGDELEQSFVARQEMLADLLHTIREQAPDAPSQHTLLCAELGEEVEPLPAEIVDAVAAVRAEVEAVRVCVTHRS